MIKNSLTVSILLLFSTISNAQIFKIKALDGTNQQVGFYHELGDHKLVIRSLKDSIIIDDFMDLRKDISILKERFLAIHYGILIGSDQSRERLLLLCINNGKLCQALHVVSLSTYDIVDVYNKKADSLKLFDEHENYEIKVNLIGEDKEHYKLNIKIHDQSKSKRDPTADHDCNKLEVLSFDANHSVFYTSHKEISKWHFAVYDPKTQKNTKQFLMGTFPTIELGVFNYYFIHNDWYEEGEDDNLLKYTYK